jgi:hypothetical protein
LELEVERLEGKRGMIGVQFFFSLQKKKKTLSHHRSLADANCAPRDSPLLRINKEDIKLLPTTHSEKLIVNRGEVTEPKNSTINSNDFELSLSLESSSSLSLSLSLFSSTKPTIPKLLVLSL